MVSFRLRIRGSQGGFRPTKNCATETKIKPTLIPPLTIKIVSKTAKESSIGLKLEKPKLKVLFEAENYQAHI